MKRRRTKRNRVVVLKKKLDKVFSLWIRNRDKKCVTCGSRSYLQNGHFVSRSNYALRYDERNCNAQCSRCNVLLRGNMAAYAEYMESRYGAGIIQQLNREKLTVRKFSESELERLIEKYTLQK